MTNWLETLVGETQARLLGLLRRSHQTIGGLAAALGLTDNAVRTHVAALGRDGLVESVGTQRVTVGKPARIYALTKSGEELFPKAYALVLGELVDEIGRQEGPSRAALLLRAVGRRAAAEAGTSKDLKGRVHAAAAVLRELGGDLEVRRTGTGWRLQGFGCPLSAVTGSRPAVCGLAQALVEEVTGQPVTECCEHGDRPRCAFEIGAATQPRLTAHGISDLSPDTIEGTRDEPGSPQSAMLQTSYRLRSPIANGGAVEYVFTAVIVLVRMLTLATCQ